MALLYPLDYSPSPNLCAYRRQPSTSPSHLDRNWKKPWEWEWKERISIDLAQPAAIIRVKSGLFGLIIEWTATAERNYSNRFIEYSPQFKQQANKLFTQILMGVL